ncbi:TPA: hypothetical protein ACSP1Y_004474 [Aeromonas hydrophila]|uniref:F4 family fimbrial subunit n=1 Tax=Aeromonas hydrophila TaxID=644 RepID=UPI0038D1DAA5
MKMNAIAIAIVVAGIVAGVSGSAMAGTWTDMGNGGTFEIKGTLTTEKDKTPWQVKVGAPLVVDGNIKKGASEFSKTLTSPTSILSIRHKDTAGFVGSPGLMPQIDFGGKVDINKADKGMAPLVLDVMDEAGSVKIGRLESQVILAAVGGTAPVGTPDNWSCWSINNQEGTAFSGGVPNQKENIIAQDYESAYAKIMKLDTELNNMRSCSSKETTPSAFRFNSASTRYIGNYVAAFDTGSVIKLTLAAPASADIKWKASLPVTVSYI